MKPKCQWIDKGRNCCHFPGVNLHQFKGKGNDVLLAQERHLCDMHWDYLQSKNEEMQRLSLQAKN